MVRIEVHFYGRVQGVGFRYTTLQIASRFEITGLVENLPDGRVHVIAEGDAGEVNGFLAEIKHRMGSNIVDTEIDRQKATAEFAVFSIRR